MGIILVYVLSFPVVKLFSLKLKGILLLPPPEEVTKIFPTMAAS
jgi:RsiW-degrading membrane proteinase PrsW (M82 family)